LAKLGFKVTSPRSSSSNLNISSSNNNNAVAEVVIEARMSERMSKFFGVTPDSIPSAKPIDLKNEKLNEFFGLNESSEEVTKKEGTKKKRNKDKKK